MRLSLSFTPVSRIETFGASRVGYLALYLMLIAIGGPVSAPVVASVFHPALAPVGVLMGVTGYIIGIYGSLLCAWLLSLVATALGF
ncbi:MAG: DUF819 family protein [Nitrospirae bacterium]|nr:DUF819 family protein [Nitrospirota bacterium]